MRILGIDPGSRLTGYGCVDWKAGKLSLVTHGALKLARTTGKATVPLEQRLLSIYQGLTEVIQEHHPDVMVVEKVFFAKNAVSALILGQARGAAILTGMIHGLEIAEYSPNEVKLSIVGEGHAEKEQVAHMLKLTLGEQDFTSSDASDALGIAVCHAYRIGNSSQKSLQSIPQRRTKKSTSLADSLGITPEMVQGRRSITLRK